MNEPQSTAPRRRLFSIMCLITVLFNLVMLPLSCGVMYWILFGEGLALCGALTVNGDPTERAAGRAGGLGCALGLVLSLGLVVFGASMFTCSLPAGVGR